MHPTISSLLLLAAASAALGLMLSLVVHRVLRARVAPKLAALIAALTFVGTAYAAAVNWYNNDLYARGGLYIGAASVEATSARAQTTSKITASYASGPGSGGAVTQALVYAFPSLATAACEDSTALTFDAGNTGGVSAIRFGDTLEWGMDQILGQADAGAFVFPYVVGTNQVKFRYCNLTGNAQSLPDASYYIRVWSDQ